MFSFFQEIFNMIKGKNFSENLLKINLAIIFLLVLLARHISVESLGICLETSYFFTSLFSRSSDKSLMVNLLFGLVSTPFLKNHFNIFDTEKASSW